MAGKACLDQHFATLGAAPGSPRNLVKELEGALGCSEVRQIDAHVSVHHPHERDVRKIESLGDHLRPEQNVDFTCCYTIENAGMRPLAARRVNIHSRHPRSRKSLAQKTLDLLRAKSTLLEVSSPAARAVGPRLFLVQTVVTDQALRIAMQRERDAAVRTGRHRPAIHAL